MTRRIAARPAFPSLLSAARAPLAAAVWMAAAVSGCAGSDDPATGSRPVRTMSVPCTPDQPAPYASGIPYLGVHGDAGNSDIIRCETAEHFTPVWHSLSGLGLTQPNTFSPDGKVLYATTTNPAADGCRLHALDAKTGDAIWCKSYAPTIGRSAVEVDSDGALYFSVGASIVSVDANGDERWRTSFDSAVGDKDAAWGLHFTPDGHVATVTSSGTVYLLGRNDGRILSSLNIQEAYGFTAPASGVPVDVTALFPAEVKANIKAVWGEYEKTEDGPSFANFLGSGDFVDNTLAVSAAGDLYVIGGGPSEEQGALVKIAVTGTADAPVLEKDWYAITRAGSATSPSISPGDRYVMISDGASGAQTSGAGSVDARVKVYDIDACNENTDADNQPERCALSYEHKLERGAVPGSPAIDEKGTVYFYEFGLDWSWDEGARDVVAFGPEGIHWSVALEGNRDWTSVVTVTDNHIIGTATKVEPSGVSLGGLVFPARSEDTLIVLDRQNGEEVFSAPVSDDSAATVTVGPDGALYVGMYGLISVLSVDEQPTLGLIRFSPTAR